MWWRCNPRIVAPVKAVGVVIKTYAKLRCSLADYRGSRRKATCKSYSSVGHACPAVSLVARVTESCRKLHRRREKVRGGGGVTWRKMRRGVRLKGWALLYVCPSSIKNRDLYYKEPCECANTITLTGVIFISALY